MKKNIIAAILLTAAVALSCTTKEESSKELINDGSIVYNPTATIKPFVLEGPATKTTLTIDATTGAKFTFVEGDALGVYPYSPEVGTQVGFTVSSSDATSCTFNGGGFGLKSGQMYAVYYPYSEDGNVDNPTESNIMDVIQAFPVSYTGQRQTSTDGETFTISDYDYLVDNGVTPSANACAFEMAHMGSLLVLDVTFPQAGNYTELTLTADGAVFTTEGSIDLTAASPAVEADATSASVSLALGSEGGSGLAISAGQTVRFCMMLAPVDLSSATVTLSATAGSTTLSKELTKASRAMVAGSAYRYLCNLDASAEETEPTNLSEEETANCYIVDVDNINPEGYYFDCTVAGNGQTVAWSSVGFVGEEYQAYPTGGVSTLSTSSSVYTKFNQNNCISDLRIENGKIYFKASGAKGNAKVVLDDVWVWHIWCTDQPGTVSFTNNGTTFTVMDRNLGATTNVADASNVENMYGLYYQFGNPIGYTKSEFATADLGGYRMKDVWLTPSKPHLQNPQGDWLYFRTYLWCENAKPLFGLLWGGGSDNNSTSVSGNATVKTMYDPCPPGYKVAPYDLFSGIVNSNNNGDVHGMKLTGNNGELYFPYNGCMWQNDYVDWLLPGPYVPALDNAARVCLWTSRHTGTTMAWPFWMYSKGENRAGGGSMGEESKGGSILVRGMGVRCVAE